MPIGNDCSISSSMKEAHALFKNNCIRYKEGLDPALKTACALLIIMMVGSIMGHAFGYTNCMTMSACLGAGTVLFAFSYYCLCLIKRNDKDILLLSKEVLRKRASTNDEMN